jgi:hypothetical protein
MGTRQEVFMRALAAFVLVALFSLSSYPAGHSCDLADTSVEKLIKSKAKELKCEEYCQFRLYDALDDIDGDSKDDFVVIFTVEGPEGANFHQSFMYVFLTSSKSQKPLFAQVGERGQRDPESVSSEQGKIVITTREYLPKDAQCCPSGHGKVAFIIKGDRLVET